MQFVTDVRAAAAAVSEPGSQSFAVVWGAPVCQEGLQRLLALGSRRARKLFRAQKQKRPALVDGRFLKQTRVFRASRGLAEKRALVSEYLEEIYHAVAEPMPESKGLREDVAKEVVQCMRFRKVRGRRPKLLARHERHTWTDKSELRLLPPGSFTDYLNLLNARLPDGGRISLKLFSNAASLSMWGSSSDSIRYSHNGKYYYVVLLSVPDCTTFFPHFRYQEVDFSTTKFLGCFRRSQ